MKALVPGVKVQILAIDPGETSGYMQAIVESPKPPLFHIYIVDINQWSGMAELVAIGNRLFTFADVVVCEDYRIYPNRLKSHSGARPYTLLELGRIELLAFEHHIIPPNKATQYPYKPLIYQAASMAKQRWPNNRIRKWLERTTDSVALTTDQFNGLSPHMRDALRHMLTFLERDGGQV